MEHENKCNKYEGLFVFQNEELFQEHLKQCSDCKAEHEKYQKVSELVKEVAPVYLQKMQKNKIDVMKRLACCFILFIGVSVFTGYKAYDNYVMQVDSYESYISEMGLPTDDYGLLDL